MSGKRDAITALFTSFAGQNQNLVIPRPFITFCQGDILAALLLSQILYWADRTDNKDGWFAKSYEDWQAEIGMTDYQIKRAINGDKRRKNTAFALKDIGIETKLMQSKYYHGAATLHYRVNEATLREAVLTFLAVSDNVKNADLNNVQNGIATMSRSGPEQCPDRSTEITTETTTETTAENIPASPESAQSSTDTSKPEPDAQPVQPHIAIIDAWYEGMPAPPIERKYKRNVKVASRIAAAGYTPEHVTAFVKAKYTEDYWQGILLPLERVEDDLPLWIKKHTPPPPVVVDLGTSEDQLRMVLAMKRDLTQRVANNEFPFLNDDEDKPQEVRA